MTETNPSTENPAQPSVKCCWLHVGMHKTGTTSVQANLGRIKTDKWRYLRVGNRSNMGKALCAMFASNPTRHSAFDKLGMSLEEISVEGARLRQRLRDVILKTKQPMIIISAEALSSAIDKKGIQALKDFLSPLCGEIRVIGYVRPPLAFKMSIFQEAVKHGKGKFDIGDNRVGYKRRFKKFDEVFGKENVILRKFDPAKFPHRCIVADFCEQIGIEQPDRESIRRTNESLTREACGILYAYRKFGPGYGRHENAIRENNRVIYPLFGVSGSKFKVSEEVMAGGLEKEAGDIRWMEKRIPAKLREKVASDGTEVSSEEDLLFIKRESCVEYATHFEKIHGVAVSGARIPAGDPVDPRAAAEFVEYCRDLCRDQMKEERRLANHWTKKVRKFMARTFKPVWNVVRRLPGRQTTDSASRSPGA